MEPTLQIIEMNWREHVKEGTTLQDAVAYCLQTVGHKKWRNNDYHEHESWNVDVMLFYCFEVYETDQLMVELFNQTDGRGWVYQLLHDRITLQELLSSCLVMADTGDDEVLH